MVLFLPLIPILAIGIIASGVATLVWYANLPKEDQQKADRMAFRYFGKRFRELNDDEQKKIKDKID